AASLPELSAMLAMSCLFQPDERVHNRQGGWQQPNSHLNPPKALLKRRAGPVDAQLFDQRTMRLR
ncbi:MAG TPA: hypothetical protein PK231_05205, partial [Acidocella sp.]|nr:hypothetical protein [Acidocella sp.]